MTRKPGMLQFLGSQSWTRLSYLTTLTVVKNKSSLFIFLDSVQERSNKTCFHFLNPVLMCKGFPHWPFEVYIYFCLSFFQKGWGGTLSPPFLSFKIQPSARFGSTYTKIGTIQRRLAWPLRKDDTQIREVFHLKKKKERNRKLGEKPLSVSLR